MEKRGARAAPRYIEADWVRFEQVLGNLLNNAVKYTDEGGKVWVTVAQEDGIVALRVRDSGIGISANVLPNVFQLFEQGPRALDRAEGGLGIGLTLVRNLAELHGGSAEGKSEGEGRGAEFVVRLPLARPPEPVPRAEPTLQDPEEALQLEIVLVDDNPDLLSGMRELLESWNCHVLTARAGREAVDVVLANRPDIQTEAAETGPAKIELAGTLE